MADTSRTKDAPFTGQFQFKVDDIPIGSFTEVEGLSVQVGVDEVPEGGQNHFQHKFPGRMTWPNLVLKRGVTDSDSLFEWFSHTSGEGFAGKDNKLTRRNGEIVLLDAARNPVRRWRFIGAFPVKWSGPRFAASSSDLATEQLEIAHEGFGPVA
jgi:phage tail-like protein